MHRREDGCFLIRADEPLESYPRVLTDRLTEWAARAPDRILVARRTASGPWRAITYAEALRQVRAIGQAFLDRKLSANRPVAILSENDLEHFLLMLAGQHVGVPTASIAPAYSLVSADFAKLGRVMDILAPGLVYIAHAAPYRRALEAAVPPGTEVVYAADPIPGFPLTPFERLAGTHPTEEVDAAHAAIAPDDIAKFLFSSGSTGTPKAVINTHRMICSNQQMILQVFRFLGDSPPVLLDWLPWNHTAGGNHNTGMILYNGGTLYIDDGRPTASGMAAAIQNLHEISPTVYFNVPRGYDELLSHLRRDERLRESFFRRLQFMFYAGAGMPQPLWDGLRRFMSETCAERVLIATGLGATETSPMAVQCTWDTDLTGAIGIPVPGVEAKLVPQGAKMEIRVKGPSVTPGYWKEPELTARAFDEEGYFKFGDAVRFVDPADINKGLLYDGRFAEDFKLASGTWVSAGPLRNRILHHFAPLAAEVVLAGPGRAFLTMLVLPNLSACRALAPELPVEAPPAELLRHPAVAGKFRALLKSFAREATGNSNRVLRALLLDDTFSLDAGEITDKGSLNHATILERRADLVEEMYASNPSPRMLCVSE